MRATIYHNVTEIDGRPAIFVRFGAEARAVPGDELVEIASYDVDTESSLEAAERAFAIGNGATAESEAYYALGVRSVSCGDIIAVDTPDGRAAYACEAVGWASVELDRFNVAGGVR